MCCPIARGRDVQVDVVFLKILIFFLLQFWGFFLIFLQLDLTTGPREESSCKGTLGGREHICFANTDFFS